MVMTDSFAAKIIDLIASVFKVPATEITKDTVALDVDGWDSLTHTELILMIEELIDRQLPLAEVMECENVGDLIEVARTTSVTKAQ